MFCCDTSFQFRSSPAGNVNIFSRLLCVGICVWLLVVINKIFLDSPQSKQHRCRNYSLFILQKKDVVVLCFLEP
jgi:hypothetical protein